MKRLIKSQHNKRVSGVLGGIAEYFDIDATVVRVIFVFLLIFTGIIPCVIFYVLASLTMPRSESPRANTQEFHRSNPINDTTYRDTE